MATSFTPDQYRQIYATLPGPTAEQEAKYQSDLAAYNTRMAAIPEARRAAMEQHAQVTGIGGPPMQPMSQQQQRFTDWLGNGGNRLGYDWNGNQTPDTGFDGFMEKYAPALTAALAGGAFAPIVAGAVGASAGGVAAGAIQGGLTSSLSAGLTGQPLTLGTVVKGAAQGALGSGAVKGIAPAVKDFTGLSEGASTALTGAGLGAIKSAIGGKNPLGGAVSGAVGSEVSGGLKEYGASDLVSGVGGSIVGNLTGSALTPKTSSGGHTTGTTHSPGLPPLTSGASVPTNQQTPTGVVPGSTPVAHTSVPPNSSSGGSSATDFLGSLGSGLAGSLGLDPNNILGSLGNNLGEALPYGAVAAIGLHQADQGRQQDQKYIDQMAALGQPYIDAGKKQLADAQGGKLSAADQRVVSTSAQQGKALTDSTAGLSGIAQAAFADYKAGKLPAADEQQLQDQLKAQKQQVRQQLASAGITDSTILAGQDQQIDNQGRITRQQLLDKRFATGVQAYDSWLTGTQAGQKTILDGQKFASAQLQQMMQNAFTSGALGMGAMESSIQMAMKTDAAYAEQVSSLLGTLTSAYAYQIAKKAGAQGGAGGGSGSSAQRPGSGGGGSGGGGGGRQDTLDDNAVTGSADHQQLLQQDWQQLQQEWGSMGDSLSSVAPGEFSLGGDALAGSMDAPDGGWLSDYQLGI